MGGRTELEQLIYQMSADIRRLETTNNKALGIVNKTSDGIQKRYDRLGAEAGRTWGKISMVAGVAFAAITAYSIKAASDAQELQNAFDKAFGAGADGARAYAKTLSQEVGRSNLEVQEGLMQFRLLLKKLDADTADSIAKRLEARAIDVGSLYNKSDQEVITKFLSGLSGESEPLKALGVQVNETAVKLELLRLGFKGNAEQAPEAAKQIARANIMLRETEIAAGDAADTLDSAANQAKRAKGEFRDAAAELGTNFLPIATKVASATADMAGEFNKLPTSVQMGALALLGLVAVSGPLARVIAGLKTLIKWAGAARIALAGVGTAGVVGGAATIGAPVALGLITSGDTPGAVARDRSPQGRIKETEALDRATRALIASGRGQDGKPITPTELARRQRDLLSYATTIEKAKAEIAAAAAADPTKAADPAIGEFALPDSLKTPVGGTKPKGSGSAASKAAAAANAARDQNDRMEDALAAAKEREVAAQRDLTRSIELRAQGALDDLDLEEAARNADLDRQVKDKALTQAQADRIKAAEALARSAERAVILAGEQEDMAEADLRQSQIINGYYDQIATIRAGMARTELERFAFEKRELELRQRRERETRTDELARQVASGEIKQSAADVELASQVDLHRAQTEELADDYTQRFSDGLQQAFENLRTKEDVLLYLADRFKARLMDNLFDVISRLLLQLGEAKSAPGGAGWLSAAVSTFAGLFASGGNIPSGQWGIVGERGPEPVRGPARVLPNSALRATQSAAPAGGGRGTLVLQPIHLDLRGSVVTQDLLNQVNAIATARAVEAGMTARAMAAEDRRRGGFTSLRRG